MPDRTAAGSLGGEVIDVGNFDAVDVKSVFVWRTSTAHDDVVAETGDGRNTRQGSQRPADVPPAAGVALDFVGAQAANAERRFRDVRARREPTTSASSISTAEGFNTTFTTAGRAGVTSISKTVLGS